MSVSLPFITSRDTFRTAKKLLESEFLAYPKAAFDGSKIPVSGDIQLETSLVCSKGCFIGESDLCEVPKP